MTRPLVALDYDGTLAPIVLDPTQAVPQPGILDVLGRLAASADIAVITGRPVAQVVELAGFAGAAGLGRLVVLGQYGAERWDAATGRTAIPEPSPAVRALVERLPSWLAEHGAPQVRIEDKGLAVALHARGLPEGTLERLPVAQLAAEAGLHLEPGRQVVELRPPGTDKGQTLAALVDELRPSRLVYVGDDLGDVPAFAEGARLRERGLPVTLVCSGSSEQDALVALADEVVDGPPGVLTWLSEFDA